MPITILSPYSGRPVKVRDQDLGRAIRDEEGRIFYVLPRSDGQGHYAAPTRKGSEKDEQRYRDLERKTAEQGEVAKAVQQQPIHDATGPGRPVSPLRLIVLLLVLLAVLVAAALLLVYLDHLTPITPQGQPPAESPADPVEDVQSQRFTEDALVLHFEPMMIHLGPPTSVGREVTLTYAAPAH